MQLIYIDSRQLYVVLGDYDAHEQHTDTHTFLGLANGDLAVISIFQAGKYRHIAISQRVAPIYALHTQKNDDNAIATDTSALKPNALVFCPTNSHLLSYLLPIACEPSHESCSRLTNALIRDLICSTLLRGSTSIDVFQSFALENSQLHKVYTRFGFNVRQMREGSSEWGQEQHFASSCNLSDDGRRQRETTQNSNRPKLGCGAQSVLQMQVVVLASGYIIQNSPH